MTTNEDLSTSFSLDGVEKEENTEQELLSTGGFEESSQPRQEQAANQEASESTSVASAPDLETAVPDCVTLSFQNGSTSTMQASTSVNGSFTLLCDGNTEVCIDRDGNVTVARREDEGQSTKQGICGFLNAIALCSTLCGTVFNWNRIPLCPCRGRTSPETALVVALTQLVRLLLVLVVVGGAFGMYGAYEIGRAQAQESSHSCTLSPAQRPPLMPSLPPTTIPPTDMPAMPSTLPPSSLRPTPPPTLPPTNMPALPPTPPPSFLRQTPPPTPFLRPTRPPNVSDTVPFVRVRKPAVGAEFLYNGKDEALGLWYADVDVVAWAQDKEDGPLDGRSVIWKTDQTRLQKELLGTGNSTTVRLYSDDCFGATHRVHVEVTDSDANTVKSAERESCTT